MKTALGSTTRKGIYELVFRHLGFTPVLLGQNLVGVVIPKPHSYPSHFCERNDYVRPWSSLPRKQNTVKAVEVFRPTNESKFLEARGSDQRRNVGLTT